MSVPLAVLKLNTGASPPPTWILTSKKKILVWKLVSIGLVHVSQTVLCGDWINYNMEVRVLQEPRVAQAEGKEAKREKKKRDETIKINKQTNEFT